MGQALENVKIADFSWAVVGPMVTKYFSDHGATVVKVESAKRPDPLRVGAPYKDNVPGPDRAGYFSYVNTNKLSLALDLGHARAIEVVRRLVAWADIVCENFSAGVMEKWGLGYHDLKRMNPDIIFFRSTAQGQTGPHATHPSYGIHLIALAGFTNITGWPDRFPSHTAVPYTDIITPRIGAAILVAALHRRHRTGEGMCIDLSQLEVSSSYFMSLALLDCAATGRDFNRSGNSCHSAAPHGVFRCMGDDRWCALAVTTDSQWRSLCKVIGNPSWCREERFNTVARRMQNERELERLLESWTEKHTAEEVMTEMQNAGIPAGVVQNAPDLLNNAHLRARGFFKVLHHPEIGAMSHPTQGFKLSRTPSELRTPGPLLGQHTEHVCRDILGMTQDEFDALLVDGVFQ